jgi:hypothetical protein
MQIAKDGVRHEISLCFGGVSGASDDPHTAAVGGCFCGVFLGDVRQFAAGQLWVGRGVAAGGGAAVRAQGEFDALHLY